MSDQARTSGVLLHVTSLPGRFGCGDLGPGAERFLDLLAAAGQGLWQVLPLGPTSLGDSPYGALSTFAGNPLLVSPERLAEDGLLDAADL
ncbi:MAG: 4-alpha-glucanotransferase, partial [Thermoanaerobaculia bacterium]